jgi:hypothetical protein
MGFTVTFIHGKPTIFMDLSQAVLTKCDQKSKQQPKKAQCHQYFCIRFKLPLFGSLFGEEGKYSVISKCKPSMRDTLSFFYLSSNGV